MECPVAQIAYVLDANERIEVKVTFSGLSEILLLDYQPPRLYPRFTPVITARTLDDVMELVDVTIREGESLDVAFGKFVPAWDEDCSFVGEGARLFGYLRVVDIMGRMVSIDE